MATKKPDMNEILDVDDDDNDDINDKQKNKSLKSIKPSKPLKETKTTKKKSKGIHVQRAVSPPSETLNQNPPAIEGEILKELLKQMISLNQEVAQIKLDNAKRDLMQESKKQEQESQEEDVKVILHPKKYIGGNTERDIKNLIDEKIIIHPKPLPVENPAQNPLLNPNPIPNQNPSLIPPLNATLTSPLPKISNPNISNPKPSNPLETKEIISNNPEEIKLIHQRVVNLKKCPKCSKKLKRGKIIEFEDKLIQNVKCKKCGFQKEVRYSI